MDKLDLRPDGVPVWLRNGVRFYPMLLTHNGKKYNKQPVKRGTDTLIDPYKNDGFTFDEIVGDANGKYTIAARLTDGDQFKYACIDIDGFREREELTYHAGEVVKFFTDRGVYPYIEWSLSGKGIHIFVPVQTDSDLIGRTHKARTVSCGEVEFYCGTKRLICLTGRPIHDCFDGMHESLLNGEQALREFWDEQIEPTKRPRVEVEPGDCDLDDLQIYDLVKPEIRDLLDCGYPDKCDPSDVDFKVAVDLNRVTGNDFSRVHDIMRASEMYREKFDRGDDYLLKTIQRAAYTDKPRTREVDVSFLTLDDLGDTPELDWRIEGCMLSAGSMLVSAPLKQLKTTHVMQLALHLATGHGKFLHKFPVVKQSRVMLLTVETLRTELQRIAEQWKKHHEYDGEIDDSLLIRDGRTRVDDRFTLAALADVFAEHRPDVFIMDPMNRVSQVDNPSSMESAIETYTPIDDLCHDHGVQPVYVMHMKKSANDKSAPDLGDVEFYGVTTMVRQWMLWKEKSYKDQVAEYRWMIAGNGFPGTEFRTRTNVETFESQDVTEQSAYAEEVNATAASVNELHANFKDEHCVLAYLLANEKSSQHAVRTYGVPGKTLNLKRVKSMLAAMISTGVVDCVDGKYSIGRRHEDKTSADLLAEHRMMMSTESADEKDM